MKTNKVNIIVLPDSSIYLNDERVKWVYENLYGQYGKNFKVKLEDGKVVVYGNIMIPHQFDRLEVKIDEVYGNVIIDNYDKFIQGNLTTLENFPDIIHGDFKCKRQPYLTSLKGGPKEVDGDFICAGCGLTSLEGMPKQIGHNLYVYNNKINDINPLLESTVNGVIDLEFNPCENIEIRKDLHKHIKIYRNKYNDI